MDIPIDPAAINKYVADAIIESAIGEAVKGAIAREIQKINSSWDNPIDTIVRNHVGAIVRDVLLAEHDATIRAKISEALAAKLSHSFIDQIVETAANRYA